MASSERIVPFDHPFFQNDRSLWRSRSWNNWDSDPWFGGWPEYGFGAPSRLMDQNFGMGIFEEDLLAPLPFRGWYVRPRRTAAITAGNPSQVGLARDLSTDLSEIVNSGNEFRVNLDVAQFKPGEVVVKTTNNRVVIHGKHQERQDEHGFIQREFKRSYLLPKDVDPQDVKCSLSADGVLLVSAPKKKAVEGNERTVPIAVEVATSGNA